MPSRYIWATSKIPPKCKLQRWETEQCVADAEKFIAEFYRHKFIKPAPKGLRAQPSCGFPGRLFRIVPALLREVSLPRFTRPLAVLRASVRAARLFRQGPLEPLGTPAQRRVDLYREPASDTREVLSVHAREPMVPFLNVMRPMAHFGLCFSEPRRPSCQPHR